MIHDYSVVIAEDESIVSRYIKGIVNSIDGLGVVRCCKSGEEALDAVHSCSADILLTDIRMHGMDGLELIRQAKQIQSGLLTVIISGYGEFEYAREAMRLGVNDFLLKPVEPSLLRQKLEELLLQKRLYDADIRSTSLRNILRSSCYGDIAGVFGGKSVYVMAVYGCGDSDDTLERCFQIVSTRGVYSVCFASWRNIVLLVSPYRENLEMIGDIFSEDSDVKTIACLCVCEDIGSRSMEALINNLRYSIVRLLVPGKKIIRSMSYSALPVPECVVSPFLSDTCFVSRLLSDEATARSCWKQIVCCWSESGACSREIRYSVCFLLSKMAQLSSACVPNNLNDIVTECIKYADSIQDIEKSVWLLIESLIRSKVSVRTGSRTDLEGLFERITSFLENNTEKNFSLENLSGLFNISQPYISRCFREYGGMSFKEYFLNLKMNTAKRIMDEHPEMLVKDVASQIGLDQYYFSTVFRRITGIYPRDYRRGY